MIAVIAEKEDTREECMLRLAAEYIREGSPIEGVLFEGEVWYGNRIAEELDQIRRDKKNWR